ncbi:MAG: winged helix-turn-helix domain-containing protein [Actinomycetota bacterium]|nr:winged helix-turn-helix domain-containing protein [Actinomycetota bacterium]
MVEIGVLGPLEVKAFGQEVELGGREAVVLSALALRAGQVVSTDTLMERLWGEAPPPTAPKALQNVIVRLRKRLQPDPSSPSVLLTRGSGYVLDVPRRRVDAHRFMDDLRAARARRESGDATAARASADAALALWRAPQLPDFGVSIEATVDAEHLYTARLEALEIRIDADLMLGRHESIVAELEELVRAHPFREDFWEFLMLALYRCGRQADALEAFQRARRVLGEELGLDPSPRLRQVEARLLAQDPVLDPPRRSHQGPGGVAGNLPRPRTPLVGREADVSGVVEALHAEPLVTLVGPGGVGKTRLALAAATQSREGFADGAWLVDLAALEDADHIDEALATLLGLRILAAGVIRERVVEALRHRQMLLVFDNCEHVIDQAAALVDALLARCPDVTVLATSREPLLVDGELVWMTEPLPVPANGSEVGEAPASRIFMEAARRRGYDASRISPEVAVEVCRRLDGLPLALELAGGCLASMSEPELLGGLDSPLQLLSDGRRTSAARQRGLRDTVAWSYDLLDERDRQVFERVAVFPGGFTAEAAAAVRGGGAALADVAEPLRRLAERSMLAGDADDDRHRMLETLRAYGLERLEARGAGDETRTAMTLHCIQLAERVNAGVQGDDEPACARLVTAEFDNLRGGFGHARRIGDSDLGLRLVGNLFWEAIWRNRIEVFRWAQEIVEATNGSHPLLPRCAALAAWAAVIDGRRDDGRRLARRGLEGAPATGTGPGMCFGILAMADQFEGRPHDARPHYERALQMVNEPDHWALGRVGLSLTYTFTGAPQKALDVLADADQQGGRSARAFVAYARAEAVALLDPPSAMASVDVALAEARSLHADHVTAALSVLRASLQSRHGERETALKAFADLLELYRRWGQWAHVWTVVFNLVELLAAIGRHEAATVLYHAAVAAPDANPVFGVQAERLDNILTRMHRESGEERFDRWATTGRQMTTLAAFQYAADAVTAGDH